MALVRAGLAVTTGPLCLAGNGVVVPLAGYDFRRRIGLVGGGRRWNPPCGRLDQAGRR
jgi:hypothetical protein